jgi:hypothetical protein
MRKDGLLAIECTLFRNESGILSSKLIQLACIELMKWEHAHDVDWKDGAITGVRSNATAIHRSPWHEAGWCYLKAGWEPFPEHNSSERADVWLKYPRHKFDSL